MCEETLRVLCLSLVLLFFLGRAPGLAAQMPASNKNLPAPIAALVSPSTNVKSVERYPSGQTDKGKALTLYVVHLDSGTGGRADLFLVDSDSLLVWSRINKPEPIIVGTFRDDLPPVFGYSFFEDASENFTSYKLLMWDGYKPRIVFDGSSGVRGETPSFVDLLGDGTREMVFYNRGSKYYEAPSIFVWNGEKQRLEYGKLRFSKFWKNLIREEMGKLERWKYSKAQSEDPLVYCAWLENYLRESGSTEGLKEFFQLAIKKLDLLAEKTGNDDLRQRAVNEKNNLHFILSGPINGILQDFQTHYSHWPTSPGEIKAYIAKNKWEFDLSLYPHLTLEETQWNTCRVTFIDQFVSPMAKVDFNVVPEIPDVPGEGYAEYENNIRETLLRELTDLIQGFRIKNGRWPKDLSELKQFGKEPFDGWDNCPDLTFTPEKGGSLKVRFTFSPEDLPVENIKFELKSTATH